MPDNARWCSQCGQPLAQDVQPMNAAQNPVQNPEATNYDINSVGQQQFNYPNSNFVNPPQPQQKKNGLALIVAIWAVVVLLLVAIVMFLILYFKGSGNGMIELNDTAADSSWMAQREDPWAKIDEQREENKPKVETVKVVEPQPVVNWSARKISATCYDSTGEYPISVTFEESPEGDIRNCRYTNVTYGTKINLSGHKTSNGYTFSGSTGGMNVSVRFQDVGGGAYQGSLIVGDKKLDLTGNLY